MNSNRIFITGHSGFIGRSIKKYLPAQFNFNLYDKVNFNLEGCSTVIHLAGKAHDLKNISNSKDYYLVNTELTKKLFDEFLKSNLEVFITLSSVKAVADVISDELTEEHNPNPVTHYGKSKLLAEQYILSQKIPIGKRVYILRPSMVYGSGNKGNLNLLYKIVSAGLPWPLGAFDNLRTLCNVENLCFVIKELIERKDIPSGVYNIADDEPISTNDIISLIALAKNSSPKILKIPKSVIIGISKIGDLLHLPLNSERLIKLTESYIVSNKKVKNVLQKPLPISSKNGLLNTFKSFIS